MRLSRDLHDDLRQKFALLVSSSRFLAEACLRSGLISGRWQEFSAQVKRLSSEVHQISHELHPAHLDAARPVAAVRRFYKEFASAHEMAVEFSDRSMPRVMPETRRFVFTAGRRRCTTWSSTEAGRQSNSQWRKSVSASRCR